MIYDFLGVTPVRPDATAGSDVRSEPDYETLNAEIEKMANPSAGVGTDWQHVAELSSGLLANKGKDLQVACYLGVALVQMQQVQGCSLALKILGDLFENYWDTCSLRRREFAAGAMPSNGGWSAPSPSCRP